MQARTGTNFRSKNSISQTRDGISIHEYSTQAPRGGSKKSFMHSSTSIFKRGHPETIDAESAYGIKTRLEELESKCNKAITKSTTFSGVRQSADDANG